MLDVNPKLEFSALQAVLKCEKLKKLEIPEHLKKMADQLEASERDKYDRVIQPDDDGYSYRDHNDWPSALIHFPTWTVS